MMMMMDFEAIALSAMQRCYSRLPGLDSRDPAVASVHCGSAGGGGGSVFSPIQLFLYIIHWVKVSSRLLNATYTKN